MLRERFCGLLAQNAQGNADLEVGEFRMKAVHRIEDLPELRVVGFEIAAAAGHDPVGTDALGIDLPRGIHDLLRIKQRIGVDAGRVVRRLGAEFAVLRTDSGLGVDDGARHDFRGEFVAYLVGERDEIEDVAAGEFRQRQRLRLAQRSAVQYFVCGLERGMEFHGSCDSFLQWGESPRCPQLIFSPMASTRQLRQFRHFAEFSSRHGLFS